VAAEFLPGNRLTLLRSGEQYFPELDAAIGAARREVFLETYIFACDATGRRITAALSQAAARGVAVRVLVDGFGSKEFLDRIAPELRADGVKLLVFRPEVWSMRFRRDRLRRMHRKIAVVDAALAFVGGINVIDDMDTPNQVPPRYDYAVKAEGPLVAPIHAEVVRLWNRVAWRRGQHRWRINHPLAVDASPKGSQRAAFVVRDPFRHRRDIEEAYLEAMRSAQREIVFAIAYFFPGRRFRRELAAAAKRGVRVVLLLQGRVEYALLHYASRALYGTLLDAGVEIFEYRRSFLHAKVAVVDGRWATVGSSNIDPFSLMLAREGNVIVDDAGFASELRASLHAAMEIGAVQVAKTQWFHQSFWLRLRMWLAYGLARTFIGMFGLGRRF
jgi:cardiolipin synthase A/B